MSRQTFNNKLKAGFEPNEAITLRDYIIEMGVDCSNIEAVNFDATMGKLLK